MNPHVPHPRRKAARTNGRTAGEVQLIHGTMNAGSDAKCQEEANRDVPPSRRSGEQSNDRNLPALSAPVAPAPAMPNDRIINPDCQFRLSKLRTAPSGMLKKFLAILSKFIRNKH
jgi:hypothetical protein